MLISFILAISSFFSFPPEAGVKVEEKWFPPCVQESESQFFVKYSLPAVNENVCNQWTSLFFQKMLQEELRDSPHLIILSPPSSSMIAISCDKNHVFEARSELAAVVEKIRKSGFSEIALFDLKQCAKNDFSPLDPVDLEEIEKITLANFYPFNETLTMDEVCPPSKLIALQNVTLISPYESFLELSISENEKKIIYKMFTTIAEKNPLRLAFEKRSLDRKGKRIHHIHPFRFLGYIFSDEHLKHCMREIRKSHFKWNAFIDGYSKKMREESAADNLNQYIPGFAEHLNIKQEDVVHYVNKHDWEGLVRFLL